MLPQRASQPAGLHKTEPGCDRTQPPACRPSSRLAHLSMNSGSAVLQAAFTTTRAHIV